MAENKVFKVNTEYGDVFCILGEDGNVLTNRGNVFPSIRYGTREYKNIPDDVEQKMLNLKEVYDLYIKTKRQICQSLF